MTLDQQYVKVEFDDARESCNVVVRHISIQGAHYHGYLGYHDYWPVRNFSNIPLPH